MTKDEKILELENKLSQALEEVKTHKRVSYQQSKELKDISDLELRLKIADENVETHKKASFEQSKTLKEVQLQRDTIKQDYEKLTKAYNFIAQLFDEYANVFKNTIGQLTGLSQATVMLEKNLTDKIKNFNKGVE